MTGYHIRPSETNVIKRLKKRNQTITKNCSIRTLINQRHFNHKLKTFFLENHNQWKMYQLINALSLNILSRFYNGIKVEKIQLLT